MDQSFSPKNLRKIWDMEARRGRDRLGLYPDARRAFEVARDATKRARTVRRANVLYIGPPESSPEEVARRTREIAEDLLGQLLALTSERLVHSVETDTFSWGLAPGPIIGTTRQTYTIAETPEVLFADKQLQLVVGAMLSNRPRSRQSIVASLIQTLDNDLPKVVIRTDVDKFYDNIDHNLMRLRVAATQMSPTCRRLVDKLLVEMKAITGLDRGLPAGVGLSAKLAELYIAQVDRALRDSPGTLYFARYVDDIVLVLGEESHGAIAPNEVTTGITSALEKLDLALNLSKTSYRELTNNSLGKIDFLGYEIKYQQGAGITVGLTRNRVATIRARIDRTFDAWDHADPENHGRRSLLLDRLRFLTGNTRLSHNKRNALVGIYFSNPHVNDPKCLQALDSYLRYRTSKSEIPPDLSSKIASLSFQDGFRSRTVYRWSMQRMKRLKGAWLAKAP